MSRVNLNQTKGEEADVLQHKVFLLINLADTNSRQKPSHFRRTHEKGCTTSVRDRSHANCAGSPNAKKTTPRPVLLVRLKTAWRRALVKDFHLFFACKLALWASMIRQVLGQRTPALARGVRSLHGCRHDSTKGMVEVSATRGKKEGRSKRKRGD